MSDGIYKFNDIQLEGLVNVRDLGGIKNRSGKTIKKSKLIRGSTLFYAKPDDLRKLYDEYGLRTIIDLRTPLEAKEKPDPVYLDVNYISNPVQIEKTTGVTHEEKSRKKEAFLRKMEEELAPFPEKAREHMIQYYRNLITNMFSVKQYGAFLRHLITAEEASLWHCHLGKDRCGMATALLLEALDVDRETIVQDYLHSNIGMYRTDDYEFTVEGFFGHSHREYIESFYRTIDELYGGLENFFTLMDVTPEDIQSLRDRYLV